MTPTVAWIQSPYEIGKGIFIMGRFLNGLRHPRTGLHTKLFLKEGGVHSFGSAWTSQSLASLSSSEKCTTSNFSFRTSMALLGSRAALIIPVYPTCGCKANLPHINIHKPKLPHSFCFLDQFIIIGVCFRINYHDNVKDLGRTRGRRLFTDLNVELIHESGSGH
ncbi:DNA-directed RNA polymerases II, IV and V subunit 3-like [Pyrus ussuriensis x Pyrus communis]|uniref:DNA-directed RNA polymerases II, IV and V subunit 3-like n=1 Tax=Pyrus ussuriensis x Pyrus communis TaxID=2448454 RepID=A0A5N5GMR8_9ROSA|nr:DNA-directed RNA polymerases II, IV and V subunit 3-like [Pyrus ussuriensis x Pyrus communis]